MLGSKRSGVGENIGAAILLDESRNKVLTGGDVLASGYVSLAMRFLAFLRAVLATLATTLFYRAPDWILDNHIHDIAAAAL